ncbi:polysaccharide deacetylase WbmS family protein [Roseimaritima ulvae]|uniref:Polysaccharide deacetylase n=1 Tax=Roseimaritima ulvae TaxID=980254 RepID=A0A5B9QLG9_9BACT|nr:hypothetical protein [Roseimaritima ulvae]QEG38652.1 hypothetical protein UC8_06100 [Roseimaritima ulvae]
MIAITFDIDWAPDAVIEDTLRILDEQNVSATFFATHDTPVLKDLRNHEIAIHPDFRGGDYEQKVSDLLAVYPDAVGARSHAYYLNSQIAKHYGAIGLQYESSLEMIGVQGVRPFRHWLGFVRIPVFWEDDINAAMEGDWDLPRMDSDSKSLYVFDFHPVHVYLNTESLDRYERARKYYHQPEELKSCAAPETIPGTRTLLKQLVKYCSESNNHSRLSEVVDVFANSRNCS